MNSTYRFFLVLPLIFFLACIPSINPIYTDEDIVFEKELVGVWKVVNEIKEVSEYDTSFSNWKTLDFDGIDQTSYELETISAEGQKGMYTVHMTKIAGSMFLDLMPDDLDLSSDKEEVLEGIPDGYYLRHFRPLHTFLKLEKKDDILIISRINPFWLEEYIEKHPEEIGYAFLYPHEEITGFVFTDTTKNLRKFLEKHIDTEGAFSDHLTFKKISGISRLRIKKNYHRIETIAEANAILKEYPNEVEIYRTRAQLLLEEGRIDEALADWGKAIELEPGNTANYFRRAEVYLKKGEYESAVADHSKAIELEPENIFHYQDRALLYLKHGDYKLALADHGKIIKLEPENIRHYFDRAEIYLKKGDLDLAVADYSKAIDIEPFDTIAYSRRGKVFLEKGDYDLAIADYSKTIELDPSYYWHYFRRGDLFMKLGDYERAVSDYSKTFELTGTYSALHFVGEIGDFTHKEGYELAVRNLGKMIELEPEKAFLFIWRAIVHLKGDEYDLALTDYRRAIGLEPSNAPIYRNRAGVYMGKSEYDLAIADYSKAIELEPENTTNYFKRIRAFFEKGDYDMVIADYGRLIELEPSKAEHYERRAGVYIKKGDYGMALDDLDMTIKLAPKNPVSWNRKAWILATCPDAEYRDGVKAIEPAKKAIELYRSPNYLDTLAAAYAEGGRFEDAVKTQKKAIALRIEWEGKSTFLADGMIGMERLEEHLEAYKAGKPWRDKGVVPKR